MEKLWRAREFGVRAEILLKARLYRILFGCSNRSFRLWFHPQLTDLTQCQHPTGIDSPLLNLKFDKFNVFPHNVSVLRYCKRTVTHSKSTDGPFTCLIQPCHINHQQVRVLTLDTSKFCDKINVSDELTSSYRMIQQLFAPDFADPLDKFDLLSRAEQN